MSLIPENKNTIDQPFFNLKGEHSGYIDILTDIDKSLIVDTDDSTKLIIYLIPPKQVGK